MPFNQIQVALIGDWRGEDDHAGWRRVRQSLAALCGPGATDVAAAAPPITVPPPAPPPRRQGGGAQPLLLALVGILTLIVGAGGVYLWQSSRAPGADDEMVVASALPKDGPVAAAAAPPQAVAPTSSPDPAAAMPPTSAFTRRATIVDPSGQAVIRGGPTGLSPILGRVDAGETVRTYTQSGDWWQVRSNAGVFGYLNRAQLRLDAPPPASRPAERAPEQAVAPATSRVEEPAPQPASAPAPAPVQPVANDRVRTQTMDQATINRRRYCAGVGRNTPQCRQLRQRATVRNY
jgi:hypothetical protein